MRRAGVVLLFGVLVGIAAPACSGGEGDGSATSIGTDLAAVRHGEECADCHEHIVEAWDESPMAHSVSWVDPTELEGLGAVTDGAGFTYRFETEGDRAYLVETPPGGVDIQAPLTIAIGAGRFDRSYAVVHGELQWFAPIERISDGVHGPAHAALAPGNEITPGGRASVPITNECLGCHTDSPPPATWPLNVTVEHAIDTGDWTPTGLSCAACHGETDAHVAWQESDLSGDAPAGEDPVLRHNRLDRFEQLSVCAACHLQGDVRIVLDQGQLGPPPPGGDLLEQRALFVAREPTNDVGFVSHVERLMDSACFLESQMTCTTCHDPHRAISSGDERARTRAACIDCHRDVTPSHVPASAGPIGERDCVDCHMRKTLPFDLAEVRIHDHWIRRDPGPPSEPGPLRVAESPDARWKRVAWPGVDPPEHHASPGLLMMALAKEGHFERALDLVDVAPGPGAESLALYHHVRGSVLEAADRLPHARRAYERAIELDPAFAPAITNLGLVLGKLGEIDAGLAHLDALIARHPLASSALRNRAVLRRTKGDVRGTIADLERALRIQPDVTVAAALSDLYGQIGERTRAADYEAEALRLDPRR